jgi:hypothetical protein
MKAVRCGDFVRAEGLQEQMNNMMFAIYGGKEITCWLSGLKQLLMEMNIFRTRKSYLNYPLHPTCRRAIKLVLKTERDVLFPALS